MSEIPRGLWILWGLFLVFLLMVILQPLILHTYGRTIIDDGYYYLGYARNIATGNGPTFDGIIITNGVQPLWAAVLIAVAFVFNDPVSLLYASLAVSALLTFVSILNMDAVLREYISSQARWLILLIFAGFALNPQMSLTGMETSLNLCILTLTLRLILRLPDHRDVTTGQLIGIGIMIGLSCLARVDNLIISPLIALVVVWRIGLWHKIREDGNFKKVIRIVFILALPTLVIFGAYLLFNQVYFDRWLPVSGEVKSAWVDVSLPAGQSRLGPEFLLKSARLAIEYIPSLLNTYIWLPLATYGQATLIVRLVLVLALLIGTVGIVSRMLGRKRRVYRLRFSPSRADAAFMLLVTMDILLHTWMIFFNLGTNIAQQLNWYYVPEYIYLTVVLSLVVNVLLDWQKPSPRVIKGIYAFVAGLIVVGMATFLIELQSRPEVAPLNAHYEAALWANENLPDDAIGGAFNAGIVGYFTHMDVINLDGLMNEDGILAVVRGEDSIWHYVQSQQIDYIMDYAPAAWSVESDTFREIPTDHLKPLYAEDFTNWSYVPSTFLIFEVLETEISGQ